jgi:hypothetical protein
MVGISGYILKSIVIVYLTFRWVCEEVVLVIGLLSPNH